MYLQFPSSEDWLWQGRGLGRGFLFALGREWFFQESELCMDMNSHATLFVNEFREQISKYFQDGNAGSNPMVVAIQRVVRKEMPFLLPLL